MRVNLTPSEMMVAAMIGVMRQVTNLRDGRNDAHGAEKEKGWQYHIEGACGEAAFAKAANKYWSGALGNLKADDVGQVQVRTRSRDYYDLMLHDTDPDDRPFVLVVGLAPKFQIISWIMGRDGKDRKYWSDPAGGRPAYFVPQNKLNTDLSALP